MDIGIVPLLTPRALVLFAASLIAVAVVSHRPEADAAFVAQRTSTDTVHRIERDVSAHLGCTEVGSIDVEEAVGSASVRFSACRGNEDGCAASGGNWLALKTCRGDACVLSPSFMPYGHVGQSAAMDVSDVVKGPGRYTVSLCDAGCGQAPSETYGPCCDGETCGSCNEDSRMARCTEAYDGAWSWGHVRSVELVTARPSLALDTANRK